MVFDRLERAKKLQEQREKEMVEKQKQQEIAAGNFFPYYGVAAFQVHTSNREKLPVTPTTRHSTRLLAVVWEGSLVKVAAWPGVCGVPPC